MPPQLLSRGSEPELDQQDGTALGGVERSENAGGAGACDDRGVVVEGGNAHQLTFGVKAVARTVRTVSSCRTDDTAPLNRWWGLRRKALSGYNSSLRAWLRYEGGRFSGVLVRAWVR